MAEVKRSYTKPHGRAICVASRIPHTGRMLFLGKSSAFVCVALLIAAGCSSSSDDSTPSTATDGGSTDGSTQADASTATDSATTPDAKPSTAACRYSVSGDRTIPTSDAVACPGYLKQTNGMGDYTINVAAALGTIGKSDVTLGFTMSCPTAPKAGDVWTLGANGCTGNISLTVTENSTGTIWTISDAATTAQKAETKLTFGNVTMLKGTQNPKDVYFLFDVTFDATLLIQPANTTTVKVSGHFAEASTPLGA
jgi:hypothetical protein